MQPCPLSQFFSPAQRIRYESAVSRRYSCRAFSAPPDVASLAALNYAAARVCLPGVRIVISECTDDLFFGIPFVERIHGAARCAYLIASREADRYATLAGISGEAFVLEATAMNIATCWVSGSYRRSAVAVNLQSDEKLMAVIPLGIPERPDEMPAHRRKGLTQICVGNPSDWPLWAYHAAEAVRSAPSAMNLQPWRMSYARHSLQLLGNRANSVDMGIALLHMDAGAGDVQRLWKWGDQGAVALLVVEEI